MKVDFAFKAAGRAADIRESCQDFLTRSCGLTVAERDQRHLLLVRGSAARRLFSMRVETWPTRLEVVLHEAAEGQVGVVMRYRVRTGLHLVGTLERAILEAEAAILQEHLRSGRRGSVEAAVAATRRPVLVAVMLNSVLAALIVAVVGLLGGYRPVVVGMVALAVGLLDGVTILAFADLMVDGARSLPRVKGPGRVPSEAAAGPSAGP